MKKVTQSRSRLFIAFIVFITLLCTSFVSYGEIDSQYGSQRCQATTQKGYQCKRNAQAGSIYCWQHQKNRQNYYVNNKQKSAITPDVPAVNTPKDVQQINGQDNNIVTTEEEIQGFFIIRAILCNTVDSLERIVMKDDQSYCAILFDNNNRKPICRLHFNGKKKYVETFDADKVGTKHLIESLNDIYTLSAQLKSVVETYM